MAAGAEIAGFSPCTAVAASMYYLKVLLFSSTSPASFSSHDPNGAAQVTTVS